MTYILNQESRASIEEVTGISYDEILKMDIEEINKRIEKKIRKKLKFKPFKNTRLIGRGSVYMYLNRLFDFNTKKLDKFIDAL